MIQYDWLNFNIESDDVRPSKNKHGKSQFNENTHHFIILLKSIGIESMSFKQCVVTRKINQYYCIKFMSHAFNKNVSTIYFTCCKCTALVPKIYSFRAST